MVSFNQLHSDGFATNNAGANPTRVFDNRGNSFYLNAAQLNLERLASKDMIVGYHIELAAGHDPSIYDGQNVTLQEGWAQIVAPLGSGLDIRVGKMATLAGFEVLESMNNFNYSRGMLFGLIQPFTNTGVRASYWFGEQAGLTIGFNNGLNNVVPGGQYVDNNHGKMLELQLATKFINLTANFTVLWGNDAGALSGGIGDDFYLFDIVVGYTIVVGPERRLRVGAGRDRREPRSALGLRSVREVPGDGFVRRRYPVRVLQRQGRAPGGLVQPHRRWRLRHGRACDRYYPHG